MTTLAIDTATPQVSVALGGGEGVQASFRAAAGRRHGETLAPAIDLITRTSGCSLGQLSSVAVDVGPGLFTGLRVGLATAKALASALGLPVATVTSLEALAHPHRGDGRPVAAVVDARRHEVFWALFGPGAPHPAPTGASGASTPAGGPTFLDGPAVAEPAAVARLLDSLGGDVLVVGDGAVRYAEELASPRVEVADRRFAYPDAEVVLELASARVPVAAEEVRPLYLRQADVRIGWAQRHA